MTVLNDRGDDLYALESHTDVTVITGKVDFASRVGVLTDFIDEGQWGHIHA
jgi:hypothetical protein